MTEPRPADLSRGPEDRDEGPGFEFSVISPARVVLRDRVTSLIVPGARGALGFWAGHAPMLVALSPGVVKYRSVEGTGSPGQAGHGAGFRVLAVGGGFFELSPDGRATLLADTAELPEEIDVARAQAACERARRRLKRPAPQIDLGRAELALERALARLRAAGKPRA